MRTADAIAGDINALAVGSLVGEKLMSIDVPPSGMRMFLIEISVKASDAFLQTAVSVGEATVVLRISGKLNARATRSSLMAFKSRSRVA